MHSNSIQNPAVDLRDISLNYGEGRGVFEINLAIIGKMTTCLLGPSGSGKSTILRLINGTIQPDAGQVLRHGRPLDYGDIEKERRKMGYAMQGIGLFPHMTVRENVTIMARLEGWNSKQLDERFKALMNLVDIPPSYSTKYPHQLSGGEMQRVGLCRALMLDPEILLLDEPFSALDPITRSEIQTWFHEFHKKAPRTSILVTHDIKEALLLADTIIVVKEGRIIARGNRNEADFRSEEDLMKFFIKERVTE